MVPVTGDTGSSPTRFVTFTCKQVVESCFGSSDFHSSPENIIWRCEIGDHGGRMALKINLFPKNIA